MNITKINCETRLIIQNNKLLGIESENEYDVMRIVLDQPIITEDCIPQIDIEFPNKEKKYIEMNIVDEYTAEMPVKSSLLKQIGLLNFQFSLYMNNQRVFKSKSFEKEVVEAINADSTIEDDYPTIMDYVQEIKEGLNSKVDKVEGYSLMSQAEHDKLRDLENYDDTEVKDKIKQNREDIDTNTDDISKLEEKAADHESRVVVLENGSGSKLRINMNTSNYQIQFELLNKKMEVVSEQTIDLPIESLVFDMKYDADTKEIVVTLENGTIRRIPVSSLVAGLVNESTFNKAIKDVYEYINNLNDGIKINIEKFNENAEQKVEDFNNNADTKTQQKKKEIDEFTQKKTEEFSEEAENRLNDFAQAFQFPKFRVNTETMKLEIEYATSMADLDFKIEKNGHLYY